MPLESWKTGAVLYTRVSTPSQVEGRSLYAGWITSKKRGVTLRGRFIAIVSQEVFDAVQRRLSGGPGLAVAHNRDNPDFPLRRFVRCAICGAGLTASWSRRRDGGRAPHYRCWKGCGVTASREAIERMFHGFVVRLQPDRESMAQLRQQIRTAWNERTVESRAQTAALDQRIERLKSQCDRAFELLVNDRIPQNTTTNRFPNGRQKSRNWKTRN